MSGFAERSSLKNLCGSSSFCRYVLRMSVVYSVKPLYDALLTFDSGFVVRNRLVCTKRVIYIHVLCLHHSSISVCILKKQTLCILSPPLPLQKCPAFFPNCAIARKIATSNGLNGPSGRFNNPRHRRSRACRAVPPQSRIYIYPQRSRILLIGDLRSGG